MEKVEEDLARSKHLREKQTKEFSRQLEDIKLKNEREVQQNQRGEGKEGELWVVRTQGGNELRNSL